MDTERAARSGGVLRANLPLAPTSPESRGRHLVYLACWTPPALFLSLLLAQLPGGLGDGLLAFLLAFPLTLLFAFIGLGAWYPVRVMPIGSTPPGKLLLTHLVSALLAAGAWVLLGQFWAAALAQSSRFATALGFYREHQVDVLLPYGVLMYLMAVAVHSLTLNTERAREAESRALESAVLAREAELKALRAQINPHFLFNSLNSVNALVGREPEKARAMCVNLAAFLRRTLELGKEERVPLEMELGLLKDYLAIEAVRFGERLRPRIDVSPEAAACRLPPLLLQPLVENAVRHGIAQLVEGGEVIVRARVEDGALRIRVGNPVDPERPADRGEGIGIENVQRRLRSLHGAGARLEVDRSGERFEVRLVLPAETGEAAA